MPRDRERNRNWQRRYYELGFREVRKRKYEANKDAGICTNCGCRPKSDSSLRCDVCNVIIRRSSSAYHDRVRRAAFEAYGGFSCVCCGETEEMFLSLDHVNGDGAQHRRHIAAQSGSNSLYVWLKKNGYPPGFQVLCMNCNQGRHRNKGVCPHKKRNSSLDETVNPLERTDSTNSTGATT
jgi:hypothetical protein